MSAYYNEIDPYCVQWLRNLIAEGLIAPGDVDDRSIVDVWPEDLKGYTQCHFFAGIAGWSLALRLAGWSDERSVWTGSCPCQPFSAAGKRKGFADERHLWPEWFRLIRKCRPATIFGEQVARATGQGWLDAVADDLEGEGYAIGAAVLPACAVAAPHERQRLWFVADSDCDRGERWPRAVQMGWSSRAGQAENDGDGSRIEWPAEPDFPRVAHGVSARVAKLRAFGNAIVPQVAAEFIQAAKNLT